jgi:long-subunit fatty acid transport protein
MFHIFLQSIYLFFCFFTILMIPVAKANLGDTVGASSTSIALANQFNQNVNDPANNFYAPALLGFGDKFAINFTSTLLATNFDPITNVTIQNTLTNGSVSTGDIGTNYETQYLASINAVLPIIALNSLKFGMTIFTPIGHLAEPNSGSPFLTEYVFYRARFQRTQGFFNFIYAPTSHWSFSLGTLTGLQTSANLTTRQTLNGATGGSSASAKANVKPSFGAIASLAYHTPDFSGFFTYSQEMKSNLLTDVSGTAELGSNVPYDISLESMMYYDPHIFRLGLTNKLWDHLNLIVTLEYQDWSGYKSPVMVIKSNSGSVQASNSLERVETKNIFIYRLGSRFQLSDRFIVNAGYSYRPSPLDGNFSGAGNSVDTDSSIMALGADWNIHLKKTRFALNSSFQYHKLEKRFISKSAGREDGNQSESKVGSPGYNVGGDIKVFALGANFQY